MLVDAITEHEPGRRLVAVKNVTVSEEFFQGHFPGTPIMPAVLMVESLSQVAAILLLERDDVSPRTRVYLRGVNNAKFRKQVVPGDRLRLEILLGPRRAALARAQATAYVADQIVAECELLLGLLPDQTDIDKTAVVHASAEIGQGAKIGPHAVIGPRVTIGHQVMLHGCTIGEGSLVGIQAIVLNHAVIGEYSLVAAGAIVTERKTYPPRSLIMGAPAKVVRELNDDDIAMLRHAAETYIKRRGYYLTELTRLD